MIDSGWFNVVQMDRIGIIEFYQAVLLDVWVRDELLDGSIFLVDLILHFLSS